jgi:hypothetical protein
VDVFIHIQDPGFPEPPWPKVRRFGAFTLDEAHEQAASDIATGQYSECEIFSAEDSEALAHAHMNPGAMPEVTDLFDEARVQERISELRADREADHARALGEAAQKLDNNSSVIGALVAAGVLQLSDDEKAKLQEVGLL